MLWTCDLQSAAPVLSQGHVSLIIPGDQKGLDTPRWYFTLMASSDV